MVLADDWMFPECLERMVAVMEAHPSVGIVGAYGHEGPVGSLGRVALCQQCCFAAAKICRQRLLGGPYVFGSPTSVLFRSDLVRSRDPFYNESNVHAADSEACFELLKGSRLRFCPSGSYLFERTGGLAAASLARTQRIGR